MKVKCIDSRFGNKEINFGGKSIKFDAVGTAEVENGKELLVKYPNILCDPSVVIEVKKEAINPKTINPESIVGLEKLIKEKDVLIEELKDKLKELPIVGSLKEEDIVIIYDMCKSSAKDLKESAESLGFKEEANTLTHKELVVFLTKQVLKDANT